MPPQFMQIHLPSQQITELNSVPLCPQKKSGNLKFPENFIWGTVTSPVRRSVRSEIFAATRATKFISPGLAVRAGRRGAPTLGNRPHKFLNAVAAVCDRRRFSKLFRRSQSAATINRMNSDERPPRLKRLDRLFSSHPLYFVTTCTDDRKPILANPKVHEDFRKFCEAGLTHGVFVGKYVLMPDHLHLFVALGDEYETALIARRRSQTGATEDVVAAVYDRRLSLLSEWMKSLKNSLSKTLRGMNVPAPHWQKGFFDHVMRSEESYSQKWLYVAENPVRNKLAGRLEDWPYQGEIYSLEARGHV
jgi:REP element-mobilizing transposase RayT